MPEMGSDYVIVFNGPVAVSPREPARVAAERPAESAFAPRASLTPVGVGGRAIPPMLAAVLERSGIMVAPASMPAPRLPLAPATMPAPRPTLAPSPVLVRPTLAPAPAPRPTLAPSPVLVRPTLAPAPATRPTLAPVYSPATLRPTLAPTPAPRAPFTPVYSPATLRPAQPPELPAADPAPLELPSPSSPKGRWFILALAGMVAAGVAALAFKGWRSGMFGTTLEFVHARGCDACQNMGALLDYAGDDLAAAGVRVRRTAIARAPAEWRVSSTPALVLRRGGRVVGTIKDRRVEKLLDSTAAPEQLLRWAKRGLIR